MWHDRCMSKAMNKCEHEWLSKISDTEILKCIVLLASTYGTTGWNNECYYISSWNSWSVLLRQTTNWGYSVPHHMTTHYKRCCRCCATTKWEIILICMRQCNLQREGCRKVKRAADATAREGLAAGETMLEMLQDSQHECTCNQVYYTALH